MKYIVGESGIKVDATLKTILQNAIQLAGNQSILSKAVKIDAKSLSAWLGRKKQTASSITWDLWGRIKPWLVAHNLISADDPNYMLPSEMRAHLLAGGHGVNVSNSINSGQNIHVSAGRCDLDAYRGRLVMALSTKLPPEWLTKAIEAIREAEV